MHARPGGREAPAGVRTGGVLPRLEACALVGTVAGDVEPEALQHELLLPGVAGSPTLREDRAGRVEVAAPLFRVDSWPVAGITVGGRPDRLDPALAAAEVRRVASTASQYLRASLPDRAGGRCADGGYAVPRRSAAEVG